jgi:hypothetical protein
MNYVLIEKTQLDAKGLYPYAELLPDGRAILPLNALKGIDGVSGIELISGDDLKVLKEQQEAGVQTSQENTEEPPATEEGTGDSTEETETVTTETE